MNRARAAALLLAGAALCGPALAEQRRGPGGGEGGPARIAYSNPSAGIAADIALSQLTGGKKGRWYALRETAAPDAVMFVPQLVLAQAWLKNRGNAAPVLKLSPYQAWASCDGSLVVTSGARRDGAGSGWYTNVWRRQPDGGYKWVFGHATTPAEPLAEPDMIEAKVAECPPRRPGPQPAAAPARGKHEKLPPIVLDPKGRKGSSGDGSLTWEVTAEAGGAHRFVASMRVGGEMRTFRDERVGAAGS